MGGRSDMSKMKQAEVEPERMAFARVELAKAKADVGPGPDKKSFTVQFPNGARFHFWPFTGWFNRLGENGHGRGIRNLIAYRHEYLHVYVGKPPPVTHVPILIDALGDLLPDAKTPCLDCHHDLEDHAITVVSGSGYFRGSVNLADGSPTRFRKLTITCRRYVPNVTKDDVDPCDCMGFRWAP